MAVYLGGVFYLRHNTGICGSMDDRLLHARPWCACAVPCAGCLAVLSSHARRQLAACSVWSVGTAAVHGFVDSLPKELPALLLLHIGDDSTFCRFRVGLLTTVLRRSVVYMLSSLY